MNNNASRPGDLILDRYMPEATPAEREEAREQLRKFAHAFIEVFLQLAAEGRCHLPNRDSDSQDKDDRVESSQDL